MAARNWFCLVMLLAVLLIWAAVSLVLAGDTWYVVQERLSSESTEQQKDTRQVEEIEVAPGVKVRADIWEDDYVPTYEDLVAVGFLPEDASAIREVECSWGAIKACWDAPDPAECCSKKANG